MSRKRRKPENLYHIEQHLDLSKAIIVNNITETEQRYSFPCWICWLTFSRKSLLRKHFEIRHDLVLTYYDMSKVVLKKAGGGLALDENHEAYDYIYTITRREFIELFTQYFMEKSDLRVPFYVEEENRPKRAKPYKMSGRETFARRMASLLRMVYCVGTPKMYRLDSCVLKLCAMHELGRYKLIKLGKMFRAYIKVEGKQEVDGIIRAYKASQQDKKQRLGN